MTTRWKQKVSVALAISAMVSLLLMLILLWSAVSNGMLSSNKQNNINISENNLPAINTENPRGQSPDSSNRTTTEDINRPTSEEYVHEEFIKPSKVHHLPLHTDDLLYESKRNNTFKDDYSQTHRITGNYRSKSSRIWDPHPEYAINAFGHHMHLMLYQDNSFVHSSFTVTNDYGNETDSHKGASNLGCHYKGHVLDDAASIVAVSLCNGMTGHIKTSYGSFFIQPVGGGSVDEDSEIVHRIWRQPRKDTDINMDRPKDRHNCPIHEHSQDYNGVDSDKHTTHGNSRKRRKRSTYGDHEYTLEVLIAVDRKMIEFHGREIHNYILTLMSIVSNIFSDASIGNSINVAVVNILEIKRGLHLNYIDQGVYASHLLKVFCNYTQRKGYRYDTAILLTREQICRNTTETRCDTLGLAELGTVCKGHSCSIVQDNGLSAAFTIAHELGHILNMPHDDDKKCDKFKKDGKQMLNIMSSTMGNEIHPWSWSDCSRHYVTEFLESDNISCMENSPDNPFNIAEKKLPGEKYNLHQQCELIHGMEAKHCNIELEDEKECGRLWCLEKHGSYDCRSSNLPWADGTPCKDHKHWCQKGECVRRDRRMLTPIHGGWGAWSEFTPCSRSCGGGVQESQRECDQPVPQNGGRYCIGNRKKYKSCNLDDCPLDKPDFREQQCAEFNGNNFNIQGIDRNVRWVPKYGVSPKDECKLFCRVEKSANYFQLADKVKDGTTCSFDSYNKCVNGICRPAGCDNDLNSQAKLDRCGLCEGNNDTCYEITGYFHKADLTGKEYSKSTFYYDVIRIPKGASNIKIIQKGYPHTNYIVLLNDENEYLLNGENIINTFKKTFPYAGVSFEYSGSRGPLEQVNTTYSRKIKKDLLVQILSLPQDNQTDNEVLLQYTYTVDRDPHMDHRRRHIPKKEIYKWELEPWSPCDSLCQGERSRTAVCINIEAGQKVSSTFCDASLKPSAPLYQACNLECELQVNVTSTSECSAKCGKQGIREKTYACIQMYTTFSKYVDLSFCSTKFKSLPKYEECREPCWDYTEWTPCSRTCDTGTQKRSVVCRSNDVIVNDSECAASKRHEYRDIIQPCNTEPCPAWSMGESTPCSVTCGVGVRSAAIYCMQSNQIVDKSLCDGTKLIPIITNCTMPPCREERIISTSIVQPWNTTTYYNPSPQFRFEKKDSSYKRNHEVFDGDAWAVDPWGECNDNCEKTRLVYCKDSSNPSNCPEHLKPASTTKCCFIKYVQRWSPCSVKCGVGIKKKEIICARVSRPDRKGGKNIKRPVDPEKCRNLIPPRPKLFERSCRNVCNWKTGPWTPCSTNRATTEFSSRLVNCTTKKDLVIPNEHCDQSKKPETVKKCPSARKIKVEMSNCTCDGYRRRKITCYDATNKHVPCDRKHKSKKEKCHPPEACILKSCEHVRRHKTTMHDGEYTISINRTPVRIYCHNMAHQPTEYVTLKSDENYSIYYASRAKDPKSCPRGRERYEFKDPSIQAGFTQFKKIRLDIKTMRIVEDDFTFATNNGIPQKFGSAGDCYNTNPDCPQGFFSINLNGTGFRIARTTKWDTYGDFASMKYLRELMYPFHVVQAYCGGYCGSCFVSKNTSLVLEID